MSDTGQKARRSFCAPKRFVLLVLLALILVPYFFSRLTAGSRQIEITATQLGEPSLIFSGELRLLVYNIAHGRGQAVSNFEEGGIPKQARIKAISELIAGLDPDIVVLNEADFSSVWSGHQNQAVAIANQANFPYVFEQANLDFGFLSANCRFGNAILSRYPIVAGEYVEFPGVNFWEPIVVGKKGGNLATIDLGESQLRLSGVHLEHREEAARVLSVKKLLNQITAEPMILAGDFNSAPTGFPGNSADPAGHNAIDAVLESGLMTTLPQVSESEQFTFPADKPHKKIDWVFASHHWKIIEQKAIHSDLSDHLPIWVRLQKLTKTSP